MRRYLNSIFQLVIVLTLILAFHSCNTSSKDLQNLVFTANVGAYAEKNVNLDLASPFEYTLPARIVFPERSVNVENLVNDGTVQTIKIQSEIDRLSQEGGGTVIISAGDWLTGRIVLKSNVNLYLSEGAILRFSGELEDFRPAVFTRIEGVELYSLGACIYANNAENIAITGKGKLIGPADGPVRTQYNSKQVIDDQIDPPSSVESRVFEGHNGESIFLPMFISPINCKNMLIEGISLEHTAFWNIVPIYCDGVTIRDVSVESVGIPRGDGIDIESSKNVLIEYCTLSCGDDCFTLKAGRGADGIRVNKPTENVLIRYCLVKEGHGGITCGSETAGMIRNLFIHDCIFHNTGIGIRFKTRRSRGGGGENLYYERIKMNTRYTAIKWDMLGSEGSVGELASRLPKREINELTPSYKNITIKNCEINTPSYFLKMIGIPETPVKNVLFENVAVNAQQLMNLADVENVSFKNVSINCPDSLATITGGRQIRFENVHFKGVPKLNFKLSEMYTDQFVFEDTNADISFTIN